jgi:hypothetical protein
MPAGQEPRTWREWIQDIERAARSGADATKWVETKWDELAASLQGKGLNKAQKEAILDELTKADAVRQALIARGHHVPLPMKYQSQLIVLIDDDLLPHARDLQKKRESAGEAGKSYIFDLFARTFEPPVPTPEKSPTLGTDSRVYVIGHGAVDSSTIGRGAKKMDAAKLASVLKAILKLCGNAPRVKRVSLDMCYGAGNPTGEDIGGRQIGATQSFAYTLFEALGGAAEDVVGRAAASNVHTARVPIPGDTENGEFVGVRKVTGSDDHPIYKGPNRKIIFYKDGSGTTRHRSAR